MHKDLTDAAVGTALVTPASPIAAGEAGAWQIVYTCGSTPVYAGGAVRFTIPYGFTPPQISYPSAVGYSTVTGSNPETAVALHTQDPADPKRANQGTFGVHLFAAVESGQLRPGDTVTLHYGKGHRYSLSSIGAVAQYFQAVVEFTVAVDPDGRRDAPRGGFVRIAPPQPSLRVVGGRAERLRVVIPSTASPGASIPVGLTAVDREGNTDDGYQGRAVVSGEGTAGAGAVFGPGDGGRIRLQGLPVERAGIVRVAARDDARGLTGLSNPCRVGAVPTDRRLFWGDLHVMTGISAGLGRPTGAYAYARDETHLDFAAITDGDDADGFFTDEEWEETRQAARSFYEPGRFVTLLASEYHERRVAGDKNIYYRDDQAPLIRWSDLRGDQPEALRSRLRGTRALTVPHHPVSGSGRYPIWDHHDPEFQRLVEIYSIWGNAEAEGCPRPNYWGNRYTNSVRNALNRGLRLGIVASSDGHDGLPGNSHWMRLRRGHPGGLAAVYAPELTRESVFDALWSRSCYGTTGARILLGFTLNGLAMGSETSEPSHRERRTLRVEAGETAPIAALVVVRNGREVMTRDGGGWETAFEWADAEPFDSVRLVGDDGRPFACYYVRVTQADGEIAWSSPIWIN